MKLFRAITALCLLMCVVVGTLWVISYSRTDQVGRWRRWVEGQLLKTESYGIVSQDGALIVLGYFRTTPDDWGVDGYGYEDRGDGLPRTFDHSGWIVDPKLWEKIRFKDIRGVWEFCGISYEVGSADQGLSYAEIIYARFLRIPYGFLLLFLLLWPTLYVLEKVRKRMRFRAGHCANCGYDLRATPERCPECGAVPVAGEIQD